MEIVRDLMTPEPIYVQPTTSLPDCARFLFTHGIRHLPVKRQDGSLLGMVVDAQVWAYGTTIQGGDGPPHFVWYAKEASTLNAEALAVPAEVTAKADETITALLRRWRSSTQDAAMVLDDKGHLEGIVSEHDVVACAAELLPPELTAAHASTSEPVTVQGDAPVGNAIDMMRARKLRHLIVMEGTSMRGVMSFRDLVELRANEEPRLPVAALEGKFVYTAAPETGLREIAHLMVEHKIGLVPVMEHGIHLSAVISRRDVLNALIGALDTAASFPG